MKITAMDTVGLTTLVLVLVTSLAAFNASFTWVFLFTVSGQALVVYMVYRVLRDPCQSSKTFDDFYEDHPIDRET